MPSPLPSEEMDDLTARVGRLEVIMADTRADVAFIKATLPHLATKAELADLKTELKGEIGGLRAELKADIGRLDARIERVDGNIARMEVALIRWVVGSTVAGIGVAFTAARLVH